MLNEHEKIIVPNEPKEVTEIKNKIIDSFKDLEFVEKTHQYFIGKTELPSVSHVDCMPVYDSFCQACIAGK